MSRGAWIGCAAWIVLAIAVAIARGRRGVAEGRAPALRRRLASPTWFLVAGYLLIAALVTPRSSGESTSPLLGLAVVLPAAYVLATLAAIGTSRPRVPIALGLALLFGGAALASGVVVLALASPTFVPAWLR